MPETARNNAAAARAILPGLVLVLAVSSVLGFRGLERQEYASDEGMWMYVAQKTWPLFRSGAWDDPEWENIDATWGWVNPPVAKYLLGASLEAQGVSWQWKAGTPPPEPALSAARLPSALLGVAGCLGVFWIGRRALGPGAAVLGGLLLAASPLWLQVSRRAMTDVYGMALAVLAVTAIVPLLAEVDGRRRARALLPWAALSGAVAGLAVGAKLNAASTPAFLGILLVLVLARTAWGPPRRLGADAGWIVASGLLFGAASVVVFVGLNPYLHEEAWSRFSGMLAFWRDMSVERAARSAAGGFGSAFYPEESGTRMLSGKLVAPWKAAGLPLLVPLAAAAVLPRLRRTGPETGRRIAWLLLLAAALRIGSGGNQLVHSWLPWLGLLGAGLAAVSGRRPREDSGAGPAMRLLVPVWLAVVTYFVWRMTFLPQSRYYLPLLPVCCLLAGWGLTTLRRDVAASGRAWAVRILDAALVAGILSVAAAFPDYDAAIVKRIVAGDAPAAARILHWISVAGTAAAIGIALIPTRGRRASPLPGPSST